MYLHKEIKKTKHKKQKWLEMDTGRGMGWIKIERETLYVIYDVLCLKLCECIIYSEV